jgi:hypothetical protein
VQGAASAAPQPPSQTTAGAATQPAGGLAEKVRHQASERLVDQKNRAIGGLDTIAEAIRGTGRQLREQEHAAVAGYVETAADELQRFSQALQQKEIGEIVEDVQRFGRTRPALFVGLAFGAGLAGARFLKSSGEARGSSYEHQGPDPRAASATGWRREPAGPESGGARAGAVAAGPADLA